MNGNSKQFHAENCFLLGVYAAPHSLKLKNNC